MTDISFTQNRELSWLRFNERVLEEARDVQVPLIERLKFVSIFDSNLDEFYMVRVGSLTDLSMLKKRVIDNKSLMDQDEQLKAIFERTRELYNKKDQVYRDLTDQFRAKGYYDVEMEELSPQEKVFLKRYFENSVSPYLNYQIIDLTHPFPHLPNLGVAVVYSLRKKGSEAIDHIGMIQVPENVSRYTKIDNNKFILLEKIIRAYGCELFDSYETVDAYTISVTRNADIDWDDEDYEFGDDYRSHMKKMLKKRKRLMPVRLEIDKTPDDEVKKFLLSKLSLDEERLFVTRSPMRLGYLFDMTEELEAQMGSEYVDKPFTPQNSRYVDPKRSVMEQIEDHDILLSYPYESMDPMIELLKEAAEDPSVVSIKITLYRIAKDSKVAEQLIAAAENGKDVVVLLELRARFDEENNIMWSSYLERAGCRVMYGFNKYKCHSKVLLITRMKDGKPEYMTQVATGNYNEKTAKLYSDFALFTNHQGIGADARRLFDHMMVGELGGEYNFLMVSPKSLPEGVSRLIDEQIALAKKGEDAYIRLKMNSISDRIIIDKLSEASNAGVKIDMLVRGITCIVPGIAGKTENLSVYSLVGRFLEHHRVYQFGRGEEAKVYISSADFMTRNLRKRVEVACPILDPEIKRRLLDFMDTMFRDEVKIRKLLPSKRYAHVENKENFIAQNALMEEAVRFATSGEKSSGGVKKIGEPERDEVREDEGFFKRLWRKLFG
ncbi:MAG: polyphosphate kinase 1 [Peptoniphilus sp.]|nr:polyphosphate kinase 1 [Peptoniphilus sp.]MDY6045166.1 polyphosphate kinase 1 [Peptoniphilus sp.]